MEKRVEERRSSLKPRETREEATFLRSGAWAVILSPGKGYGVAVGGKKRMRG